MKGIKDMTGEANYSCSKTKLLIKYDFLKIQLKFSTSYCHSLFMILSMFKEI
jgi:hypothetical protein